MIGGLVVLAVGLLMGVFLNCLYNYLQKDKV